jgi:hypothetical protein
MPAGDAFHESNSPAGQNVVDSLFHEVLLGDSWLTLGTIFGSDFGKVAENGLNSVPAPPCR